MNEELKKELVKARELSRAGKYDEALEIFDRNYEKYPDEFNQAHKDYYSLTLYKRYVKDFTDEDEFFKAAEHIAELSNQKDTTNNQYCIYTVALFVVLRYLNSHHEYYSLLNWLEKINPNLLGQHKLRKNGRTYSSNLESYYEYSSKAYLYLQDYEKCIEYSRLGLKKVKVPTNHSDSWHFHRMAKAFAQLKQYDEALIYFDKTLEAKKEWYVYRDAAKIHIARREYPKAIDYLCPAVLSNDSRRKKVNLYYLIYQMFNRFNRNLALPHAKLYYSLKLESGARVPDDILALDIDETTLNSADLEKEVKSLWIQYKFRNQELREGTVVKYVEEKGYGFIKTGDDSIFFHKNDFEADDVFIGQKVSFYTEKNFDKSKNKESLNAVYINGL